MVHVLINVSFRATSSRPELSSSSTDRNQDTLADPGALGSAQPLLPNHRVVASKEFFYQLAVQEDEHQRRHDTVPLRCQENQI